jgi:ATP-dependent Clp protease adapter protein ClpS
MPTKAEFLEAASKGREILDSLPPAEEMATPEMRRVFDQALADVRDRRDPCITLEHLLRCVLSDPTGADILLKCGVDVDVLGRSLSSFLEQTSAARSTGASRSLPYERVLDRARLHSQWVSSKRISVGDIIAQVFREPDEHAVTLLKKQGLTRLDVLRYVAHGFEKRDSSARLPRAEVVTSSPQMPSTPGRYDVVLHNDDYTTSEFVMELLAKLFGKTTTESNAICANVQKHGRGVVAEYDLKAGLKKLARADRRAEKAGFPLKLTLEPAGSGRG